MIGKQWKQVPMNVERIPRSMIWAQTAAGVIGKDGRIPWRYTGDFRRFKRLTLGATVVMGRLTFESIGKPLPGRTNVIVSSRSLKEILASCGPQARELPPQTKLIHCGDILTAATFTDEAENGTLWFIGGARIYEDAMDLVDLIDVTIVPDEIADGPGVVKAPAIDPMEFTCSEEMKHPDDPFLRIQVWTRNK